MTDSPKPEELIDFPCMYTFKALGTNDEAFSTEIAEAVRLFAPVPLDAIHLRPSGKGHYQSVSILVHLESYKQLVDIYAAMKNVNGLRMLL